MKVFVAALGCFLLLQAGCHSPPTNATGSDPAHTVQNLMQESRAALPRNWTVVYDPEDQVLTIERNKPVLTSGPAIINGPPGEAPEPPNSIKPSFLFSVQPYLSPAAWQEKHAGLEKRLVALEKRMSPQQGKEGMGRDRYAHNEAEKPLAEEHNRLLREQREMPAYYYRSLGLSCFWYGGTFEPFEGMVNETEREECLRVYKRFLELLQKYEPLPAGAT
jgi:hypothetical protein